jgi:metal-responsive CopG/Arc/MetJ family transcriptional regulator
MRIHVKKISVPPKLYEELEELAKKKGVTINQLANDLIVAGLKRNKT